MAEIRMAQFGVKHGHAAGKVRAMQAQPAVELVGVYEPDADVRHRAAEATGYAGVRWLATAEEALADASVAAVAIEGSNAESLAMAQQAVAAGKHLWYDKPAGDDWPAFQRLIADAQERRLLVQMGYMYRYHAGFRQIAGWVHDGVLGAVFSVRAHMSTSLPATASGFTAGTRADLAQRRGGIFYDLSGHMLDQVVWLLGRPQRVSAVLRNDASPDLPAFRDNTLGIFEYERALAVVDIAAMETAPAARRFEVYGTSGSAIMEPFEPAPRLTLQLTAPAGGYERGRHEITLPVQPRQDQYDRELAAFLASLQGRRPPDRSAEHELVVQETLLRATHGPDGG
jgi:predicted dehydrogenase